MLFAFYFVLRDWGEGCLLWRCMPLLSLSSTRKNNNDVAHTQKRETVENTEGQHSSMMADICCLGTGKAMVVDQCMMPRYRWYSMTCSDTNIPSLGTYTIGNIEYWYSRWFGLTGTLISNMDVLPRKEKLIDLVSKSLW